MTTSFRSPSAPADPVPRLPLGDDGFMMEERREAETLRVDVAGFEGPLDLLLALARTHKLDLTQISMQALAEQYLRFIEDAAALRLQLAADYLVMAAWLAYLKSRLLLPRETDGGEEPSAEDLALMLAFRLRRLEAMREAAARMMAGNRLGREVFGRGLPEGVRVLRDSTYTATVYDLLKAYADGRRRTMPVQMTIRRRSVWSIKQARTRLEALMGTSLDWDTLDSYLRRFLGPTLDGRTVTASAFGAVLELAREGQIELTQTEAFGPIRLRRRSHLRLVETAPGPPTDEETA